MSLPTMVMPGAFPSPTLTSSPFRLSPALSIRTRASRSPATVTPPPRKPKASHSRAASELSGSTSSADGAPRSPSPGESSTACTSTFAALGCSIAESHNLPLELWELPIALSALAVAEAFNDAVNRGAISADIARESLLARSNAVLVPSGLPRKADLLDFGYTLRRAVARGALTRAVIITRYGTPGLTALQMYKRLQAQLPIGSPVKMEVSTGSDVLRMEVARRSPSPVPTEPADMYYTQGEATVYARMHGVKIRDFAREEIAARRRALGQRVTEDEVVSTPGYSPVSVGKKRVSPDALESIPEEREVKRQCRHPVSPLQASPPRFGRPRVSAPPPAVTSPSGATKRHATPEFEEVEAKRPCVRQPPATPPRTVQRVDRPRGSPAAPHPDISMCRTNGLRRAATHVFARPPRRAAPEEEDYITHSQPLPERSPRTPPPQSPEVATSPLARKATGLGRTRTFAFL